MLQFELVILLTIFFTALIPQVLVFEVMHDCITWYCWIVCG